MKLKLVIVLAALLLCAGLTKAQTTITTNASGGITTVTNTVVASDIYDNIGAVLGNLGLSSHPSNYAVAVFMGHSMSGNQLSAGFVVVENVNNFVGVIGGLDHLWYGGKTGSGNVVAGGITLKAPTHPLSFLSSDTNSWTHKVVMGPYVVAMVGTPLNGTGSSDGGLASITRAGINVDVYNISGWELALGGDYGKRTGAGNYSGDWVDVMLNIRKGF